MNASLTRRPGVFGKVPSHGDFITRGLDRTFVEPWDRWLRAWLSDGQRLLGSAFQETFLRSPAWRFVLGPGIAGPGAWAGVKVPSADRVGRTFPLTLAIPVQQADDPFRLIDEWTTGFLQLEVTALSMLDGSLGVDRSVEALSELVASHPLPPPYHPPNAKFAGRSAGHGTEAVRVALHEGATPILARDFLAATLSDPANPTSFWWTLGLESLEPCGVFCRGLPAVGTLPAFLDGRWLDWRFERINAPS